MKIVATVCLVVGLSHATMHTSAPATIKVKSKREAEQNLAVAATVKQVHENDFKDWAHAQPTPAFDIEYLKNVKTNNGAAQELEDSGQVTIRMEWVALITKSGKRYAFPIINRGYNAQGNEYIFTQVTKAKVAFAVAEMQKAPGSIGERPYYIFRKEVIFAEGCSCVVI